MAPHPTTPVPVSHPADVVDESLTDYDMDVVQTGDEIHFVCEDAGIDEKGVVQGADRSGQVWQFQLRNELEGHDREYEINFPDNRLGDGSYTVELLNWPGRDD